MIYIVPFTQRGQTGSSTLWTKYYAVIGSKVMPYTDPNLEEGVDYVDLPHAAKSAFTWDMDSNNDITTAVRTHSGYIRIMDTGVDDNDDPFDWRDIIPTGSMTTPFTLWEYIYDQQGVSEYVLRYFGYLQPDSFQSALDALPAEREYPICCPLQALSVPDFTLPAAENAYVVRFADVLYNVIMASGFTPDYIYIPGTECNDWLSTQVPNAHYIQYEINGNGASPLTEKPLYNCRQVLEEFCQLFGLCVTIEGRDWVFMDLKAGYTQYKRLTLNDLYHWNSPTLTTLNYETVSRSFPTRILASSKMEVLQGYGTVKVNSSASDEEEVLRINKEEIINDFSTNIGQWVYDDPKVFWYYVGNSGNITIGGSSYLMHYWEEPDGKVQGINSVAGGTTWNSAYPFGNILIFVARNYKDDDGEQHGYTDVYEAVNMDTVKIAFMLNTPWPGEGVNKGYCRNADPPLLRFSTPLYHYTEGAFIEFKFKLQYIKDALATMANAVTGSFLNVRIKNVFSGQYYDGTSRSWSSDSTNRVLLPTVNGQQRSTYGTYYSILEKSTGFCIPAGGSWNQPLGGSGVYEIDILGWWDNGGSPLNPQTPDVIDTSTLQSQVCITEFEVNVVHTRSQKTNEGDTEVEIENISPSTEEKSQEIVFGCSNYVRNSNDSLPRATFSWNVGSTTVYKSPQQRIAETLASWGAKPREILTLKWAMAPEFTIGLFNKYQITDQMGVTKKYMVLGYKRDLESGNVTVKLIEID